MELTVSALASQFFRDIEDSSALDDAIVDYVTGLLGEQETENLLVQDLDDILVNACPSFASWEEGKRLAKIIQLLEQVEAIKNARASSSQPPHKALSQATSTTLSELGVCVQGSPSPVNSDDDNQTEDYEADNIDNVAVAQLSELCCCCVSQEYLGYILVQRFAHNVELAAEWLLEQGELAQLEVAWQEEKLKQQELQARAVENKKKEKQQVLAKFDLQVVSEVQKGKKTKAELLPVWTAPDADGKRKVRYRDGQVVSCKGEKYIVEQIGEEWDGGSKGKVYTKGKRGKGYI